MRPPVGSAASAPPGRWPASASRGENGWCKNMPALPRHEPCAPCRDLPRPRCPLAAAGPRRQPARRRSPACQMRGGLREAGPARPLAPQVPSAPAPGGASAATAPHWLAQPPSSSPAPPLTLLSYPLVSATARVVRGATALMVEPGPVQRSATIAVMPGAPSRPRLPSDTTRVWTAFAWSLLTAPAVIAVQAWRGAALSPVAVASLFYAVVTAVYVPAGGALTQAVQQHHGRGAGRARHPVGGLRAVGHGHPPGLAVVVHAPTLRPPGPARPRLAPVAPAGPARHLSWSWWTGGPARRPGGLGVEAPPLGLAGQAVAWSSRLPCAPGRGSPGRTAPAGPPHPARPPWSRPPGARRPSVRAPLVAGGVHLHAVGQHVPGAHPADASGVLGVGRHQLAADQLRDDQRARPALPARDGRPRGPCTPRCVGGLRSPTGAPSCGAVPPDAPW